MGLEDELSGGEVLYDKTRDLYVQVCSRTIMYDKMISFSGVSLPADARPQELIDYSMEKYSILGTGKQELYESLPLKVQMKANVREGQEIYYVGVIYPSSFNGHDFITAPPSNLDN